MKHTSWSCWLSVTSEMSGVIAHAKSVVTRLLADRISLTQGLLR